MGIDIKIWGCRGSLPAPKTPFEIKNRIAQLIDQHAQSEKTSTADFLDSLPQHLVGGYGGNTACIEVSSPKQNLIIDGGSGIRRVGEKLLSGPCGSGKGEAHILFTHFHWDHIIGLPFFVPLFIPGNNIHLYSVQPNLEDVFKHVFQKPYFPVPYEQLGANLHFHQLAPREAKDFGDMSVTPYQLDHPDPCWGYKFEVDNKSFSYCVDTECRRMSQKELGPDLPLYQNVDLMLFDAQYTFREATERINWGHASAPIGLDIALREKVKRIYFVHHDPAASDDKIFLAQKQTKDYYESFKDSAEKANEEHPIIEWGFAFEGQTFEV